MQRLKRWTPLLLVVALTTMWRAGPCAETLGEPVLHELEAKETQDIPLALLAHQAITIDLEQLTGTVALSWTDPSNESGPGLFTQDGVHGHIRATIVSVDAGTWQIRVTPRGARRVQYRISLGPPRTATDDDSERAHAEMLLARAEESRLAFRAGGGKTLASGDLARIRGIEVHVADAERDYQDAIAATIKLEDGCEVRNAFNGLSHFQIAQGEYAKARASAQRALDASCADPISQAHSLRVLQSAAQWLGDLDATIITGEQALAIYRQSEDMLFQGLILGNLSSAYVEEGATGKGLDAALQALELARLTGDREGVIFDQETIGGIRLRRGEYQLALDAFNRTLEDLKSYPYPDAQAMAEDDLGDAYGMLGDTRLALENLQQAQRTAHDHANPSILIDALNDEGSLELGQGRFIHAARLFSRASALSTGQTMARKKARAERGWGAAQVGKGDLEAGTTRLLAARALANEQHDSLNEVEAQISLGDALTARRERPEALKAYQQAVDLARASHLFPQRAAALARMATSELSAGDPAAAKQSAEEALTIVEEQRGDVDAPGLRSTFLQHTRGYYDLMIRTLMALYAKTGDESYQRAALEAAENSRARALTDLLSERSITIHGAVTDDLLARRNDAQDALRTAGYHRGQLPGSASPEVRRAADLAVDEARRQLDQAAGDIRAANRRFGELTQPTHLSVDDIQRELLDSKAVLLEFWLSQPASYLWEVTSERVRSFRLGDQKSIESAALKLRERLVSSMQSAAGQSVEQIADHQVETNEAIRQLCADLSQKLHLYALASTHQPSVVLVADGALRAIPIELLPQSANATIGSRHSVTYLPAVGALRWLRSNPYDSSTARAAAVVADPVFDRRDPRIMTHPGNGPMRGQIAQDPRLTLSRLPGSRQEARTVAANFTRADGWLALDFDANRQAVMQAPWQRYQIAHFATHALIDARNPELSGIVLSLYDSAGNPLDGFLRVTDIYNLHAPVQLVVLSACDSAADAAAMGNDVYSLADAFFYAGAPRLMASLWEVNDQAAATFMSHFYKALVAVPDATPASALHDAKRAMAKDPRWHSPAYWSAFVLQGDWR